MSSKTADRIQIALAQHRAGRLVQAEAIYRQILTDDPKHAETLNRLGVLAMQTGRLEVAVKSIARAIAIDPSSADYPCNLGEALRRLGRPSDAISAFEEAIRLNPDLAVAHNNLGITLAESGQIEEAILSYMRAIQLKPDYAEAYNNLGNALTQIDRFDEAFAQFNAAIRLQFNYAQAHNNLGVALAKDYRFNAAIDSYQRAIHLKPDYDEAYSNLGNALAATGNADDALTACRRAVQLNPNSVGAHWNLAVILLRQGHFEHGLPAYEWRWKSPTAPRTFRQPQWTGENLTGKTILLHAEQGFGDTIQFVRYAPIIAAAGARVILECQSELLRLLKGIAGIDETIERGQPLPDFDCHCPLMSLPLVFKTRLETIPSTVPYLHADPGTSLHWKNKILNHAGFGGTPTTRISIDKNPGRRSTHSKSSPSTGSGQAGQASEPGVATAMPPQNIGLAWAGNPTHSDDRNRSIKLSELSPLARPGLKFHSLQKGDRSSETPPDGMNWTDHTAQLTDFADTAACISNLDLVITVDTAVAHLAAAMGKPVWLLLAFLPDWRWLMGRDDSPWYPTMRLFRQPSAGDWATPIRRVVEMLGR